MICFDGTAFFPHSVLAWYKVLKSGMKSKYSEYTVLVLNQNFKAMVFLMKKKHIDEKERVTDWNNSRFSNICL